jgi:ParB-like chromosome segregation protein Spo0J
MSLQYGKTLLLTTCLSAIDVVDRQNPPTEQQIAALAELIKQDGEQRQPILIRGITRGTYKVVCGATRLLALRRLGWPKVKAQIVSGLPIDYLIAELSDDISFKSLTREQQFDAWGRIYHELTTAADVGRVKTKAAIKQELKDVNEGGKQTHFEFMSQSIAAPIPVLGDDPGPMPECLRRAP